ncbi:Zinc finger RING/FYVE/PHD-type protein [Dioscorea alata]|uniref:Zinc finger RING/FYVE/PHD-type protein n=1 Tax=Dioscorea alata TaxID=55571 RepID=A0ACB7TW62_DIOAL|nr:Zinc finger RING/FYVE/PHD-type protein [Dioscorea alata]
MSDGDHIETVYSYSLRSSYGSSRWSPPPTLLNNIITEQVISAPLLIIRYEYEIENYYYHPIRSGFRISDPMTVSSHGYCAYDLLLFANISSAMEAIQNMIIDSDPFFPLIMPLDWCYNLVNQVAHEILLQRDIYRFRSENICLELDIIIQNRIVDHDELENSSNDDDDDDDDEYEHEEIFINESFDVEQEHVIVRPPELLESLVLEVYTDEDDDEYDYEYEHEEIFINESFDVEQEHVIVRPAPPELLESLVLEVCTDETNIEYDQCVICMEEFIVGEKIQRLPCSHCFHENCIFCWFRNKDTCPICRYGEQL